MAKLSGLLVTVALVVVIVGVLAQVTGLDTASGAFLESLAQFGEPCYELHRGGE